MINPLTFLQNPEGNARVPCEVRKYLLNKWTQEARKEAGQDRGTRVGRDDAFAH